MYAAKRIADPLVTPQRVNELLDRFPDRVPVVLSAHPPLEPPTRTRLLLLKDSTVCQLMTRMRRMLPSASPERGLVMFVDRVLPPATATIGELYALHRDPHTHALHVVVREESVFGASAPE